MPFFPSNHPFYKKEKLDAHRLPIPPVLFAMNRSSHNDCRLPKSFLPFPFKPILLHIGKVSCCPVLLEPQSPVMEYFTDHHFLLMNREVKTDISFMVLRSYGRRATRQHVIAIGQMLLAFMVADPDAVAYSIV